MRFHRKVGIGHCTPVRHGLLRLLLVTNNCPNLHASYTESTFQITFFLPVSLHLIQDVWPGVFVRLGDWPLCESEPWGWCIEAVIRRVQIRDAPSGALNFCHARHQTDSYKSHTTLTVGLIIVSTPRLMRQARGRQACQGYRIKQWVGSQPRPSPPGPMSSGTSLWQKQGSRVGLFADLSTSCHILSTTTQLCLQNQTYTSQAGGVLCLT